MPDSVARPVQTLRDQATKLEAALSVCLAEPTRKAVHELRTETRRVEAQLELLRMISGLPRYRKPAEKLLKRLRKLRRLAGEVRDCDVQDKLLADDEGQLSVQGEDSGHLDRDRETLQKHLRQERSRAEHKLVDYLQRRQPKVARELEDLLRALKPAEDLEARAEDLAESISRRVERALRSRHMDVEHLHELRKTTKRARYQCETLAGPMAAAAAKRMEEVQDAGGAWHDLLDLSDRAAKDLGADHSLGGVLQLLRAERLAAYVAKLDGMRAAKGAGRPALSQKRASRDGTEPRQSTGGRRRAKAA
ncbi:MAG TPA: CHAD domain-containing protein [Acidobacteriaceae bacterium]|jgi:CHAD domain-containing protein|nr:CHAD domain-containing protein [Acidobacteriaceae bacterium]